MSKSLFHLFLRGIFTTRKSKIPKSASYGESVLPKLGGNCIKHPIQKPINRDTQTIETMRLVKNDRLRGGDMPGTHQNLPTLSLPPPAFQKHPAEGASLFAPVFCSIITRRSRRRNPLEKNSKFQALNLVMPPAAPVPRSTQGSLQTVRSPAYSMAFAYSFSVCTGFTW